MAATVIGALRRHLPAWLRENPRPGEARRRAVWAITHCRSAEMGGHLHACDCGKREFHFHSCNHRSCPQCGKADTAAWVERELRWTPKSGRWGAKLSYGGGSRERGS